MTSFKEYLVKSKFFTSKVQLKYTPDEGIFIVANETVFIGDMVTAVNPDAFLYEFSPNLSDITRQRVIRAHALFDGPGRTVENVAISNQLYMLITFLSEYHEPTSYWNGYWQSLQNITLPFMLDEEHRALLNDNGQGGFLMSEQTDFMNLLQLYKDIYPEDAAKFLGNPDTVLWGLGTIMTRSHSWGEQGDRYVIMPGLDMYNHDSTYMNHYYYSTNHELFFYSTRQVLPGSQVVLSYRNSVSNSHLLQHYGFSIPRHMDDHVLIRFSFGSILQIETNYPNYFDTHVELVVHSVLGYDDHVPTGLIRSVDLLYGGHGYPTPAAYDRIIDIVRKDIDSFNATMEEEEAALRTARGYCPTNPTQRTCPTDAQKQIVYATRLEIQRLLRDILASLYRDKEVCACMTQIVQEREAKLQLKPTNTDEADSEIHANVDNTGTVTIADIFSPDTIEEDAMTSAVGDVVCGACQFVSRRQLAHVQNDRPMRVLTIGLEFGDDDDGQ